jgi:predicted CopG family antitoxin
MSRNRTISISLEYYNELKKFGFAGESMNQAIGKLLQKAARGFE